METRGKMKINYKLFHASGDKRSQEQGSSVLLEQTTAAMAAEIEQLKKTIQLYKKEMDKNEVLLENVTREMEAMQREKNQLLRIILDMD